MPGIPECDPRARITGPGERLRAAGAWIARAEVVALQAIVAFARAHPGRIEDALHGARGIGRFVDVGPLEHLAREVARGAPPDRAAAEETPGLVDAEYARIDALRPDDASVKWCRAVHHASGGEIPLALGEWAAVEAGWPGTLYARKSLACRAAVLYATEEHEKAAGLFARYAKENPNSAYAWLAATRAGHAWLRSGDAAKALVAYQTAARRYGEHEILRFLLPVATARALEALGRFPEAADRLREAIAAWPPDATRAYGTRLELLDVLPDVTDGPDAAVTLAAVEAHAELLDRPGVPSGDLARFPAAERCADGGDPGGAASELAVLVAERPESPLAPDARERLTNLAIRAALTAETVSDRDRFVELAEDRGDPFGAVAAALVRSLLLLGEDGGAEKAAGPLAAALERWRSVQPACGPESELERDVAKIRLAACPAKPAPEGPYRVLSTEVSVTLADGSETIVRAAPPAGDEERVLRFSAVELGLLEKIIGGLGGDERTTPRSVMGVPRPKGGAEAIAKFLGRFLPIVAGHWGGWHLATLPRVLSIAFADEARSSARVNCRANWCSGREVEVERRDGGYVVTRRRSSWKE